MNIIELYRDYNVDHLTEGHKHCQEGWVNTPCPFCSGAGNNPGYHLGYHIESNYFYCWRCGWHPVLEGIERVLNIPWYEAKKIVSNYLGWEPVAKPKAEPEMKRYLQPKDLQPLNRYHQMYLQQRGYDVQRLIDDWGLRSLGPSASLDGKSYRNRIFIPIVWNGHEVSFTSRLARRNLRPTELRYKVCLKDREAIPSKHILYGNQEYWKDRVGVCVEGPTDVWRMGKLSFATCGIEYTQKQLVAMYHHFDSIAVMFDPEPQAQTKANELVRTLQMMGKTAFNIKTHRDPGEMNQFEADALMSTILRRFANGTLKGHNPPNGSSYS